MIDDVIIGEIVPRYNWLRNQHNDWLIIAERPAGSISYIQDENTSSTTHANRTEMGESGGQHGQSISIASDKVWGVEQGRTT